MADSWDAFPVAAKAPAAKSTWSNFPKAPTPAPAAKPKPLSSAGKFGLGVRDVLEGSGGMFDTLAGPLNTGINALTGTRLSHTPFRDAGGAVADRVGLPKAGTNNEKLYSQIVQGATSAAIPIAGAEAGAAKGIKALAPFATKKIAQVTAGGAGGGAGEYARQKGASPLAQIGANLAGGVAGAGLAEGLERAAPLASRAYTGIRSAISPSRASPEARSTALFIRKSRGTNQLAADQAAVHLDKFDKRFEGGAPQDHVGFYNFVENRSSKVGAKGPGAVREGVGMTADENALAKRYGLTNPDVRAANAFKKVFQGYAAKASKVIRENTGTAPQFVKDYFTHMWQEDEGTVERAMARGVPKQGSGRNFLKREIPTISDGIAMGLTPKFGPVQTAQVYAQNMSRFISTHEIQGFLKSEGHAQWFRPGQHPEGWVPLKGILTERKPRNVKGGPGPQPDSMMPGGQRRLSGPEQPQLGGPAAQGKLGAPELNMMDPQGELGGRNLGPVRPGADGIGGSGQQPRIGDPEMRNVTPPKPGETAEPRGVGDERVDKEVLYAPPPIARLYNNEISQPFRPGVSPGETLAYGAHKLAVNSMLWEFALSAYHVSTMAFEAYASTGGAIAESLSRGDLPTAMKSAARFPVAPLARLARGDRMLNELKSGTAATPFSQQINDRLVAAGGRIKIDRDFQGTAAQSFYQSMKKGTLKRDVKVQLEQVLGKDRTVKERASSALDGAMNAMSSITGPLFEDIIPRMRLGAFAHMMEGYMKGVAQPTEEQMSEYAARALDSVDNRFGELIQDNLFWNKKTLDLARIPLTSFSWEFGSAREMLGGLHDIPESVRGVMNGQGITPRTAYVLGGMMTTVPLINSIAQYLKTGKGPSSVQDLEAYQTGGTDPRLGGAPERGLFPGNQKEAYEWLDAMQPGSNGIGGYARGKLNNPVGLGYDLATNTNYKQQPIYGDGARDGALADELSDRALPISVNIARQGQKKGSKISGLEQDLGVRPAPVGITNPKGLADIRAANMQRSKSTAENQERKRKAQMAMPAKADSWDAFPAANAAPKADSWDAFPAASPAMKDGATAGGDIRPQFKPIVDLITSMPEFGRVNAENDLFHSARDVHGDGRAMDFSIKGKGAAAPAFVRKLRQQLLDKGFDAYVRDEYNNPSKGANGGHIHVQLNR